MPFISESMTSAIKSRFGYHQTKQQQQQPETAGEDSAMALSKSSSSPDLLIKSAARSNLFTSSYKDKSSSSRFDDDAPRSFDFKEDPAFWKEHNVQVIIRLRPLSSSELSVQGHTRCVKQDSSQSITWTGHPESRYTFDLVADESVSQEMLFKVSGVPMVENCVEGYNSCMFAYGQTGSGKTHTMLGDIEGGSGRHSVNCGMTPRVFEYLFSRIQKEKDARREEKLRFTCRCSFLEIYNEQILDLLDPASSNLQIREDTKKGVYVENLTEVEVTSAREVIQQLIQGASNRKVAATNMNRASSRSHSVFTCIIESKWESQGVTHYRFARLNLVDLAGSERQKSSGAEGERLKEATNINKSLSTLGLVIMNLVNVSNGKSLHVPYRDSKLTFLLQDSLGGNAKTIIIANISPSSCCSLETLSTLKFAQRAKFIKNHAIVNEDASGDVLALRLENQNLKKEVSRLQGLVNGGTESYNGDVLSLSFPQSPGSFKWDGFHGFSSPLISQKKMSHLKQKEYEVALVGAFRREKDKDTALQALTAENQAVLQLAKQREDEIQGLKMRLRFREAGIKRLEAVASGKISAETHLLNEKEEHLKEIEVLRSQVDRNQEVTRFAMENLRLKEEIRRLKSFCEEGERERVNEQLMILENKLLEALDWKLMHESDPSNTQKGSSDLVLDMQSDSNFLSSNQGSASPWRTSMNEENEFLRMQAIQNQSELDALQKRLDFCIEEKEKLERRVNDLAKELEVERSSRDSAAERVQKEQTELPSAINCIIPNIGQSDQTELQTMVDAIAAASEREAEAHEMAVFLSKENDGLRMKLRGLIEDNNKLIDLYEGVVAENRQKSSDSSQNVEANSIENHNHHFTHLAEQKDLEMQKELESLKCQLMEMHEENDKNHNKLTDSYEGVPAEKSQKSSENARNLKADSIVDPSHDLAEPKDLEMMQKEFESLKCQLTEMHEENDKLLSLFEKAMQERDELKRVIASGEQKSLDQGEFCPEKLVEIDGGHCLNPSEASNVDDTYHSGDMGPVGSYLQKGNSQLGKENHLVPGIENLLEETHLYDVHVHSSIDLETRNYANSYEVENQSVAVFVKSDDVKLIEQNRMDVDELQEQEECNEVMENPGVMELDASGSRLDMQEESIDANPIVAFKDLNQIRQKLFEAQEKLAFSAQTMSMFTSLERVMIEVDELSENIGRLESELLTKQQEHAHARCLSSELQKRKDMANKKLSALKHSLRAFSASISYFEQREAQARFMLNASSQHLAKRKEEMNHLQISRCEMMDALSKFKQSELELKDCIGKLRSKVEEENRKLESDRVLFAIDNVENTGNDNSSHRNWQMSGKATELLKSEEEKTKLQNQIKLNREKLGEVRKEAEAVNKKLSQSDGKIQVLETELQKEILSVEEMDRKLQSIAHEKEMLLEVFENGRNEFESMIIEYQQSLFHAELKEEELKILDEELLLKSQETKVLEREKSDAARRKTQLVESMTCNSSFVSDKMMADLDTVRSSVVELNQLFEHCTSLYC